MAAAKPNTISCACQNIAGITGAGPTAAAPASIADHAAMASAANTAPPR